MNDEEIEKLDREHRDACIAFLAFSDILDDARKARDAAREIMLVASRNLNEACKGKFDAARKFDGEIDYE